MDTFCEKYMSKFLGTFSHMRVHVQWNLNDPVINKAVLLGCNKELDGTKLTSVNWSHPLLTQMPASQIARTQICMCSKRPCPIAEHMVGYGRSKCKHVFVSCLYIDKGFLFV